MKPIQILYLYPNEMNFYGDTGNVIALQQRLAWRGISSEVVYHHVGRPFRYVPDIVVGGGGQDSGQLKIYQDLLKIGPALHALADQGVPMLMVCGLYQLFGQSFTTSNDQQLEGIGIFNMETVATPQRLVGNVRTKTRFGELIGFENHSGQTKLRADQAPLGKVLGGFGNDASGASEGAIYKNAIGTYLHGPLLPRNPRIADSLLAKAMEQRGATLPPLPPDINTLAEHSREHALKRLFN